MIDQRPLPEVTPLTEPFWSAAREHRLVIQRCDDCAAYRFPPEIACVYCGSLRATWTPVSGRAALWSWTVAHPPLLPYFAQRAPWPVTIVQLDEGPRMVTSLVDVSPEEYAIGMALVADFEKIGDEITLVVFRRA
ncbi:MAG: OB-fold domain-containing protein [Dehalococcoidia bacterium]